MTTVTWGSLDWPTSIERCVLKRHDITQLSTYCGLVSPSCWEAQNPRQEIVRLKSMAQISAARLGAAL